MIGILVTVDAGDVVLLALAAFAALFLFVLWVGARVGRLLCRLDLHRWGVTNANRSAFCRRRYCDAVKRC